MNDINTGVLKTRVIELVNEHAKLAQVVNDSLFSFAELGFHEVETAKFLTATLERHGFTVERGVAGIYFVARHGMELLRGLHEALRTDCHDHQILEL